MGIEKKTGIFYELLIRGSIGSDHQDQAAPLGSFAGGHYIEGEAIVEDGEVKLFTPGPATPIPQDKIGEYLGDKIAAFTAGLDAMTAAKTAAEQRAADLESQLAAANERLTNIQAALVGP